MLAASVVPKQVLHVAERLFANFFWGMKDGQLKLHWRKWASISRPKSEGGLGIRNLVDIMHSLHLKLAWDIK
ncbi:hypothetical protein PJP14_30025, partial [Mycobacterium kansasii]